MYDNVCNKILVLFHKRIEYRVLNILSTVILFDTILNLSKTNRVNYQKIFCSLQIQTTTFW